MRVAALVLIVLVAGCRGDGDLATQNVSVANPFHDELTKLSPGYQRLTLLRALRRSNYGRNHCQNVDNAGYQQEHANYRMWVAECSAQRRKFAAFFSPNGEVQIRDCADVEKLDMPRCRDLPPPVADPTLPKIEEGAADEAFENKS